ncbi:hypothetical protein, partial [Oceanispirochaeta sp.]|uniref:hypothetical protein n=1 Tax=Oceanispirochaeta sp. TaxID=2035350 RepID=UPI00262BEB47
MNTMMILLISILIIIGGVYAKFKVDRSTRNSAEPEEQPDLNEKFLHNSQGQGVVDLVKTFNASDNMILRSILDSKGIDTYVKSNNFGNLYPTFDINNFASSVIS